MFLKHFFHPHTLANVRALSAHFRVDRRHAEVVRRMARRIFNVLSPLHKLTAHDAHLLEYAAILHDIGFFISPSAHHKHGAYIVRNSEIFGLSPFEQELVAVLVRYHRKAHPQLSHREYERLSVKERIRIMKLASILRCADALDRSHTGVMAEAGFELTERELLIHAPPGVESAEETSSLEKKGALLNEVFGITPIII
ncbi:MAG: HD domain-containing protein [Lentisphaerae bacterium]|nr:MAG: HD domain-containing protein [Lentisphaerota bacterium]